MFAFLYVSDHPNFTTTKKDGSFEIPKVPPGRYRVMYSYRASPAEVLKTIEIKAGARETLHFRIEGSKLQVQPHLNKFGTSYKAVVYKEDTGEVTF